MMLVSCSNTDDTSPIDSSKVDPVSITGYQKTIMYGESLDFLNMIFKYEGVEYTMDKLNVDASGFDSNKVGMQDIKVTLKNDVNIERTINIEVKPSNKLNVLMIGNSWSDDTIQWANEICADLNIEANICNLYIGGCNLITHYSNILNNSNSYEFRYYDSEMKLWVTQYGKSIKYGIEYFNWDYITLQQASGISGLNETYTTLEGLVNEVKNLATNPKVKIAWHLTWAYQSDSPHADFPNYDSDQLTMYYKIISAYQKAVKPLNLFPVIPTGTAVQNARTSFYGDYLTRDGFHLSYTLGRFIAGLTLVKTLTGVDLTNEKYKPEGVTDYQRDMAIEAVENAYAHPFEITDSTFTDIEVF